MVKRISKYVRYVLCLKYLRDRQKYLHVIADGRHSCCDKRMMSALLHMIPCMMVIFDELYYKALYANKKGIDSSHFLDSNDI